ncbi:hypothetical protein SORBI_3006G077050 [Sorghum bicolor]|uniref:Secreted protein n=1 Tax=Sorghum bicolor TaxID=4558 RepID=A0A1Z5RCR6_SORBI|nr:hypothetical protein SORBI_3006G077050 [Sorghum bicolor]
MITKWCWLGAIGSVCIRAVATCVSQGQQLLGNAMCWLVPWWWQRLSGGWEMLVQGYTTAPRLLGGKNAGLPWSTCGQKQFLPRRLPSPQGTTAPAMLVSRLASSDNLHAGQRARLRIRLDDVQIRQRKALLRRCMALPRSSAHGTAGGGRRGTRLLRCPTPSSSHPPPDDLAKPHATIKPHSCAAGGGLGRRGTRLLRRPTPSSSHPPSDDLAKPHVTRHL